MSSTEDLAAAFATAISRADAAYAPILPFEDWLVSETAFDAWDEAALVLADRRALADPADVARTLDERLKAAAVDTGAIEGLYDSDRGFTMSLALETISLDQAEVDKGAAFRRNYEAQLEGFRLALDVATGSHPITEVLLRQMHEVTCAGQPTYRVITPVGVQERDLTLGAYKTEANHPQRGDGSYHSYAPVLSVADEMGRLVDQMRTPAFDAAHPVVQAAYAHHAFVRIHPFPDGNGRVARLLASIWLLRAASIPLWIETLDRERYIEALELADAGRTEQLAQMFSRASLRLLRELATQLDAAPVVERKRSRDAIREARDAFQALVHAQLTEALGTRARLLDARESISSPTVEVGDTRTFTCVVPQLGQPYWISVGIDWGSGPDSRFVLMSGQIAGRGNGEVLALRELFDEEEIVPEPDERTRRRLRSIVDRVVAAATTS